MEKNAIVVDEEKIANIKNNYFINIAKNLSLKPLDKNKVDTDMFENLTSIKKVHETFPNMVGNKCNRVKGHGITYPNDVIKELIYNMNYRV